MRLWKLPHTGPSHDVSIMTIAACPRQRSHFHVRVPRDPWPHFTLSDWRFPQPREPCLRIYIPQELGGSVIFQSTGFPFRRLLRLAGSVEVLDPASTRVCKSRIILQSLESIMCPPFYNSEGNRKKSLSLRFRVLLRAYSLSRIRALASRCRTMDFSASIRCGGILC
jgi:hypothetical protein